MENETITILGIDQGYANLGFAILSYDKKLQETHLQETGTIVTTVKQTMPERLLHIYEKLQEIGKRYPDIQYAACEQLFYNHRMANGRNKSASIVYTNMSTGVVFLFCGEHGIEICDYPPTAVKKALTGNGKSDKSEIQTVLENFLKKEGKTVKTNHESDAIAIALTLISKQFS